MTSLISVDFESNGNLDLSQENKNKVELPETIKKSINKIIELVNSNITREINKKYKE